MGRGTRTAAEATTGAALRGGGEIASLYDSADAEITNLNDVSANTAARATAVSLDDDGRADQLAIMRLTKELRKRNPGKDASVAGDQATALYAQMCQRIERAELSPAAVAQFAALIGEDATSLLARIARD